MPFAALLTLPLQVSVCPFVKRAGRPRSVLHPYQRLTLQITPRTPPEMTPSGTPTTRGRTSTLHRLPGPLPSCEKPATPPTSLLLKTHPSSGPSQWVEFLTCSADFRDIGGGDGCRLPADGDSGSHRAPGPSARRHICWASTHCTVGTVTSQGELTCPRPCSY